MGEKKEKKKKDKKEKKDKEKKEMEEEKATVRSAPDGSDNNVYLAARYNRLEKYKISGPLKPSRGSCKWRLPRDN